MSILSKIIKPIEGFQYSVNIAYDIYDEKKIKSYIPSTGSLQLSLIHISEPTRP